MRTIIGILLLSALSVLLPAGCTGGKFSFGDGQDETGDYTIMLITLSTTDHVQRIGHYKTETEKDTRWQGLFVVHKATHSTLYWGKYHTPAAARKNLKAAKSYIAPAKIPIYAAAMVIPLPGKHVGPPELDLNNAVGEYSVAVAVFYDVLDRKPPYIGRKRFAVD